MLLRVLLEVLIFMTVLLIAWVLALVGSRKQAGRTRRRLVTTENVWNIVDEWAIENRYRIIEQDDLSRTYERETHNLGVRYIVKVAASPEQYLLEAWLRPTRLNQILSFNLLPEEMVVEGKSFVGSVPRRAARDYFNRLLGVLGVQLVL